MSKIKHKKKQDRKPDLLAKKTNNGEIVFSEAIEAFNADFIVLQAMEKTLPDHVSSICRFWILRSHTMYETLLYSYIHTEDDADQYKDVTQSNQKNAERLQKLKEILSQYGAVPADDIMSDFNVLISLRNYIAHGQWSSDDQKSIVQNSSFPTNVNYLDISHLNRIKHVYDIILTCLLSSITLKASHYDQEQINKILRSINIDPVYFNSIEPYKRHRLLFIHLGMPSDLYDSCLNDKKELEIKKIKEMVSKIPSFNWDKLMEMQKCFSDNIKWSS